MNTNSTKFRVTTGLAALALALTGLEAVTFPAYAAGNTTTLTVTTTADIGATAGACGNNSITVPSTLSLREATCLANNINRIVGDAVRINVPAGTYSLSNGELQLNKTPGSNVTVTGAGQANTVINAGGLNRVLDLDPSLAGGMITSIIGVTITGGADNTFGGAGIIAGSGNAVTGDILTISNSTITDNHVNTTVTNRPGGGVQFIGGSLTITNSTISNNSSGSSSGSGVLYYAHGNASGEQMTISGTAFTGNSSVANVANVHSGGALVTEAAGAATLNVAGSTFVNNAVTGTGLGLPVGAAIYAQSGNLVVKGSTFTGNSVTGGTSPAGGAVNVLGGSVALRYNRFAGNVASSGSAAWLGVGSGASLDAADNWWGCNGGPGTTGCDTVGGGGGGGANSTPSPVVSPRLVLITSASPASLVGPNATATITAALTQDSAGSTISASQLGAFDGVPVNWSNIQPTGSTVATTSSNLGSGVAQTGYNTHAATGAGQVTATLDNAAAVAALSIKQVPVITSASTSTTTVGSSSSFTITTTGFPTPAITKTGTLPAGMTFTDNGDGTATLNGTPTEPGSFSLNITANNGVAPNAVQTLTLKITQAPSFTSPANANFTAGTAGSFTVTTRGAPTSTITRGVGNLPTGLKFTDNSNGTATLDGTPSTGSGGTYSLDLTAANGANPNAKQTLIVTVNEAPSVITNPADQTVNPGVDVTFSAAAAGAPVPKVQWQRSINGGNFTDISGATSPSYTFTAAAADNDTRYRAVFSNVAGSAASNAASLTVGSSPSISSVNATSFAAGSLGGFTVTTSGFPHPTLTISGQLPTWLKLVDNANGTGTLSGTPPAGSGGSYEFTLRADNGNTPSANQQFTLTVTESPTITSADHALLIVDGAGDFLVTTSPGFPLATTVSKTGTLPTGLTFTPNGNGGATLSGTPAPGTAGTYPLTITATNGASPATTQTFTLTIIDSPTITSADHGTFTVGAPGSFTVTTSGGGAATAVSYTGTLPTGVSFIPSGRGATLSGTPAVNTGGTYPITITADDGLTTANTQQFTLTINQPPRFTSNNHTTIDIGTAAAFTVTTAAGVPANTTITESGTLPAGVKLTDNDDGTATLGGTATENGTFPVTLTASNGVDPDTTQAFTITVDQAPLITSADHATFETGIASSFTVTTTSGFPTDTSLSLFGALPPGVTFVAHADGTATISGTPQKNGPYPLTLAADNGAATARQNFTLTVHQPPTITSNATATFKTGTASSFTITTSAGYPTTTTLTENGKPPSGVTFKDNLDGTATLAGTPAADSGGTYPLTISASNAETVDATQTFTLTVGQPPAFISPASGVLVVGQSGDRLPVQTRGFGPATITETGVLPTGVVLNDNQDGSATLSGTPAAGTGGVYPLTLTASNGVNPDATQHFSLTVNEAATFTSATTATFPSAAPGTFTISTNGYPHAAISETGQLPTGVTLHDNGDGTATLAGAAAEGAAREYTLTLTATNGVGAFTNQSFTLTVAPAPQTITFTSTPPAGVVGQTYALSATGGNSANPVTFSVDSTTTMQCTIDATTVTFTHPGSCIINAHQAGNAQYSAATGSQTASVSKASTAAAIAVQPRSVVTTIAPVAPGTGTPSGTVTVSVDGVQVGSAPLVNGVATVAYTVPAGRARNVSATYSGDTDYTPTSASTARHDPVITAAASSSIAKTKYGWYRAGVTVRFHCTITGASLSTKCPSPVTLMRDGAGQSVSRTIEATDGGSATITVRGINIDRMKPTVSVSGVRSGASYIGAAPPAKCAGADKLSGVATCTLTQSTHGDRATVTAKVADRAGNTNTVTVNYQVLHFYVLNATYRNGAYDLREGRAYTLVALTNSSAKPRFYAAAPSGRSPHPAGNQFRRAGSQSRFHRYTLSVHIDHGLGRYRYWNLGVRTGTLMHLVKFHPVH